MASVATALTLTYQTLLTTTMMKMLDSGVIHDNVTDSDPLLQWLNERGRIRLVDGGERIAVNIMTGLNTTVASYAGYDVFNTTGQEGASRAFYAWKQYGITASTSGLEEASNEGKEKLKDIARFKVEQAMVSFADKLSTDLPLDGTGNSSKNITGLAAMNETTPGTTSYANVSTSDTLWRNRSTASVGAATVNLIPNLRTLVNNCNRGKGGAGSQADGGFTTQTVYEALEAILFPHVRYSDANISGNVNVGIGGFTYHGMKIMWTPYMTTGEFHVLNSKHVGLSVHRKRNIAMLEGGFQQPINQDAKVALLVWMGNFVTNNRRKGGKLSGIT